MLRVRNIKVLVEENNLIKALTKKLKIEEKEVIDYIIIKKSIDARCKEKIYFVYELDVNLKNENKIIKTNDIFESEKIEYKFNIKGNKKLKNGIVIVGAGPAGLFAAYVLAENGYKPLIIERGKMVDDRIDDVETFFKTNKLNIDSNVQFGEGGAGTFSDGKLNTMVKDNVRHFKVFETFVKCGAPSDIMYSSMPHIGTDLLRIVIKNMREKIIEMGGTFLFENKLDDLIIENNELKEIVVNDKKIKCDALILAIGHSARDTFTMLLKNNLNMEAKPFALGLRVIHSQDKINESQYGKKYKELLPNASYKLTNQVKNRGVYTFCMCPGGYVINASSEKGYLATNGMSNHDRDSGFANRALIVTVGPKDFGNKPLDGVLFQRDLEKKAFDLSNGKIPIQLLKDFKNNKKSTDFGKIKPIFKSEYAFNDLNKILPLFISEPIKESFKVFGKKIKGFDNDDTILAGVESRTSSPIRIIRNDLLESNIKGIYPCGEGAGYAGGITSAAIDGIKVAEEIAKIYEG